MKSPSVLVTGASGFVGLRLCKRLADEGCTVRYAVRSSVRLAALPFPGMERCVIEDIGPATDWSKALYGIDTIVHLAARVHQMNDQKANPLAEFRHVNVAGTERLAQMAAKAGVKRIVFTSSVKVHGEEREILYCESDPLMPQDNYGISKMEAERILRQIEAKSGLEVAIVRPPLVYGPGVKANFLSMMKVIASGFPLPLASVANKRSMIYVGNLIDALSLCVRHPAAAGRTYLVSDGDDVSTPELIRRVSSALNKPARLYPFPISLLRLLGRLLGKSPTIDRLTGTLLVDITNIQAELGWRPPFTMQEGLSATAEWFLSPSGTTP